MKTYLPAHEVILRRIEEYSTTTWRPRNTVNRRGIMSVHNEACIFLQEMELTTEVLDAVVVRLQRILDSGDYWTEMDEGLGATVEDNIKRTIDVLNWRKKE